MKKLMLFLRMKRYQKATFCVLFVIFAFGFILYRSEYLKLRNAFELGGLIDSPELPTNCLVLNDSVVEKEAIYNTFSKPRNQWTLVNGLHVFSAFLTKQDDGKTSAIALGIGNNEDNCNRYKCHVWYTKGGLKFSVHGVFSCDPVMESLNGNKFIEFNCKVDSTELKSMPNVFVFIDETGHKHFIPIHPDVPETFPRDNKAALCLYPDVSGLDHLHIVQYLSYYQLIGFTDVIAYDNSIHHGILSALELVLYQMKFLRSFSVISWNFPFPNDIDLSRAILERDCILRTKNRIQFVQFVTWDDFLYPVGRHTIIPMIEKLDHRQSYVAHVARKICCTNSRSEKNSDKSWPILFKNTLCRKSILDDGNNKTPDNKHMEIYRPYSLVKVPKEELLMRQYTVCESLDGLERDSGPHKYLVELMESKLVAVWRSGRLSNL